MTNVDNQKPSSDAVYEHSSELLSFRDFFNAEESDLTPFAEAIQRSPYHKVNIAIHPYFLEEDRFVTKPGVKQYNKMRGKYVFEAAQAGNPIIIFEECTVMDDTNDFMSKYGNIHSLPNVMFVKTMEADPTPYTAESKRVSDMYEKLANRLPYYKPWNQEECNDLKLVADEFNLTMPYLPIEEKLSFDQYIDIRKLFTKADLILSHRAFDKLGQRLLDLKVERVSLGGTKYEPIAHAIDVQKGCVSFTAVELHRLGFRVNISNYFVYPNKPSRQVQATYRKLATPIAST